MGVFLPSQPALSYEHIENFTKNVEVRWDLGNRLMWRGSNASMFNDLSMFRHKYVLSRLTFVSIHKVHARKRPTGTRNANFRQKIVFVIFHISMLVLNFPISGVSTLYDWVAS